MFKSFDGAIKSYIHQSKAYWWSDVKLPWSDTRSQFPDNYVDEVTVGFYYIPADGTPGEFNFRWYKLGNEMAIRLESFSDSWQALFKMTELHAIMISLDGQDTDPSPEEFCMMLKLAGFVDKTPYQSPYSNA